MPSRHNHVNLFHNCHPDYRLGPKAVHPTPTSTSKTMKLPLRIAILMCDSPLYQTAEQYGTYGGVFSELLKSSAESLKEEVPGLSADAGLTLTSWDVDKTEDYPQLDDIDAILITGSRASAFEDAPWIVKLVSFVQQVLSQSRVRIIGVCFGHQILGRALGLPVDHNELGWELSVTPVSLTANGQLLFKNCIVPHEMSVQQMHRDIVMVSTLPDDIENLGYTETCKIQGMHKKRRFISVQGHPEFTPGIVRELVEKRFEMGIFTKEMFEDAMRRLEKPHDGVAVGAAFLRFLLED